MTAPPTNPEALREALARYTVVYEGDPDGVTILAGMTAPGRAVAVTLGDALAERAAALAERDEARTREVGVRDALTFLLERVVYEDSYGVPGSEFSCCHLCDAGGAPGVAFKHKDQCPVLRCEAVEEQAKEDWLEFGADIYRLEGELRFARQSADDLKAALDAATAQAERTAGELAAAEARIAELEGVLSDAANEMQGVTVFVTSRERIKHPEGTDFWRDAIAKVRAALTEEPPHAG